jgi:hypothetical protein
MVRRLLAEIIWALPCRRVQWRLFTLLRLTPPRRAVVAAINKRYLKHLGRLPDLQHPKSWTEKLQWLKLNDRNPLMPVLADKYRVREYVTSRGLGHLLTELLGVYEDAAEIDFSALPKQFVLKVNHDSGSAIVVPDSRQIDEQAVRKKLKTSLATPYSAGIRKGEWHYLPIPRKILAEAYLGEMLANSCEYRIHCFNGKAGFITVGGSVEGQRVSNLYDQNWQEIDAALQFPRFGKRVAKPELLEEMLEVARVLAKGLIYVRVDLYQFGGRIHFGELTFFPGSGFAPLDPIKWDYTFGDWLEIPVDSAR